MSTLSIRKIPKEIEKALIRDAKTQGKTKTDIVIEALAHKYHLEPLAIRRQTIRHFFGQLTRPEYHEFLAAIKPFSEIDPEMWK